MLAILFDYKVRSVPAPLWRHYGAIHGWFVHAVAASPLLCELLDRALILCAALFTIGLWTRLTYAGIVATFFVALLVRLEQSGTHNWGLPFVTMIGWLAVPWGDGLSIDRSLRQRAMRTSPSARSRAYGFAIWLPGLTLGSALLAAACAKIVNSGPAWITSGAVKYHFVTDAQNAAVDWGLWVATHHSIAVAVSLAAVVVEAGFILVLLVRQPLVRMLFGAMAGLLLLSFYLFQGMLWWPWLMLLLAFLPWSWLDTDARARAVLVEPLRPIQLAVISVVVIAQLVASATRTEMEPLLSNYGMYSSTYASTEQYDRILAHRFTRVVDAHADGAPIADSLQDLTGNDRSVLISVAEDLVSERIAPERIRELPDLCRAYQRQHGSWPERIVLTLERAGFDWTSGRFRPYSPLPVAPVPLAKLCEGALREDPARRSPS